MSGWRRSMGRSKLHRRCYDQKRVGSYGGVAALQRVVPAERDVERWLSMQDAYTLHKPVTRRFKRRCVVVGGPNQQWQADLVDMYAFETGLQRNHLPADRDRRVFETGLVRSVEEQVGGGAGDGL